MTGFPPGTPFVDFWTKPLRPEPLALFRILLGAVIFVSLLSSLAPFLDRYLGPDGLCPADGVDDWLRRTHRFTLLRGPVGIPFAESLVTPDQARAWNRGGRTAG